VRMRREGFPEIGARETFDGASPGVS